VRSQNVWCLFLVVCASIFSWFICRFYGANYQEVAYSPRSRKRRKYVFVAFSLILIAVIYFLMEGKMRKCIVLLFSCFLVFLINGCDLVEKKQADTPSAVVVEQTKKNPIVLAFEQGVQDLELLQEKNPSYRKAIDTSKTFEVAYDRANNSELDPVVARRCLPGFSLEEVKSLRTEVPDKMNLVSAFVPWSKVEFMGWMYQPALTDLSDVLCLFRDKADGKKYYLRLGFVSESVTQECGSSVNGVNVYLRSVGTFKQDTRELIEDKSFADYTVEQAAKMWTLSYVCVDEIKERYSGPTEKAKAFRESEY
jgi:hypothetical protein